MAVDKQDFINAVNASLIQLQRGIGLHCSLIKSILDGEIDVENLPLRLEVCPQRSRELLMKDAIKEAIDVLEESRKAFKSKKLEALRKKLTQVLIDAG